MKGIKYIIGALAAASLLFSFPANAQENANRDEDGNVVRGAYETNKAFDNTFIGIGVGVNSVIGSTISPATWGKIGFAGALDFGKWWTPAIGARIGYQGITNQSRKNVNVNNGDRFFQHYLHADFLWNISNTIGGYKETRLWNFVPYATMGVLDVNSKKFFGIENLEYAAGVGLLNVIRLSDKINLTIDLKELVGRGAAYGKAGRFIGLPTALVGLNFNFGKTNFDRHSSITPVVIPVPFTTEQYNALADKVKALEAENAALKDKVAALEKELEPFRNLVNGQTYLYENGTFTAVDVQPGSPITLYFNCGSSKLSAREKAHLEYFTANAVNADTKLSVNGYADKQTGNPRINQKLSEERVKTVVDLLKKAGAKEGNIETAAHGDKIQPFQGAAKNRVVTIELQ